MSVPIKSLDQINKMRVAGKVVARAHELIEKNIRAGVTTNELDKLVSDFLEQNNATSNFKGYQDYPKTICTSINDQVIHGIPNETKIKDGDLVSVDLGAVVDGFHGDAARTFLVGNVSDEAIKLAEVTKKSFFVGIEYARAGIHLHEISGAIQDYVESNGFSVVRRYVGHGIGKALHEPPSIPNFRPRREGRGIRIAKFMTFAIEPMVNAGTYDVDLLQDGWTVVTKDRRLSAHYENTILVTDTDPEILTI